VELKEDNAEKFRLPSEIERISMDDKDSYPKDNQKPTYNIFVDPPGPMGEINSEGDYGISKRDRISTIHNKQPDGFKK
jgi:hypothetical protein